MAERLESEEMLPELIRALASSNRRGADDSAVLTKWSTRVVLPMPGSPATNSTCLVPASARPHASRNRAVSAVRPTMTDFGESWERGASSSAVATGAINR